MPRFGTRLNSPLVGLDVRLPDGRMYGRIIGVYDCGAGEIIDISKTNQKTEMVPYTDQFIRRAPDGSHYIIQPFEFLEDKPE